MAIEVGAKVTWRHGKSKPGRKAARAPNPVANCIVIDSSEDGRARIQLPESFGNRVIKVPLVDLEEGK